MLLSAALFFGLLAVATTAAGMLPRVISARIWIGLPFGLLVVGVIAAAAALVTQQPRFFIVLTAIVLAACVAVRLLMRA